MADALLLFFLALLFVACHTAPRAQAPAPPTARRFATQPVADAAAPHAKGVCMGRKHLLILKPGRQHGAVRPVDRAVR
jgi:hypothetical protein